MLEGKSEKLEFQEMLSSPHWKIKMSKNKTKMLKKKEPRKIQNQRKNDEKEEEMNERTTKNDPSCNDKNDHWSDHPKTQFGSIYLFFETMNIGPHYVPEKSILIERGYLD